MNFYLDYSINLVYIFLAVAFIWLNLSLVISNRYLLLNRIIKNNYISFGLRVVVLFILAYMLEQASVIQPHSLYSDWQTYAIFLSAIFLLSMPGLLYLIIKKYL